MAWCKWWLPKILYGKVAREKHRVWGWRMSLNKPKCDLLSGLWQTEGCLHITSAISGPKWSGLGASREQTWWRQPTPTLWPSSCSLCFPQRRVRLGPESTDDAAWRCKVHRSKPMEARRPWWKRRAGTRQVFFFEKYYNNVTMLQVYIESLYSSVGFGKLCEQRVQRHQESIWDNAGPGSYEAKNSHCLFNSLGDPFRSQMS